MVARPPTPAEFRHVHEEAPYRYQPVTVTGVACCFMVTCDRCGAVVLMRTVAAHDQWHHDNTSVHYTPMGVMP